MELKRLPVTQSENLESQVMGCSLSTHWWGITKKAGSEALDAVAISLGTSQKYLKIEKRLIGRNNTYYKNLCRTKNSIVSYWKDTTLPYVESGVRLIRKDNIQRFEIHMASFRQELTSRVSDMIANYEQLKTESRQALKGLYNESDYPENLIDLFSFYWEYPNLNPPEYLMLHNPELYRRQQQAVKAKFEDAVLKAEKAFGKELQDLVVNLAERMSPNPDGSKKIFRDTTVTENFKTFFKKFNEISVSNSSDLNAIVAQAESILGNVNAEYLRADGNERSDLATKMKNLSGLLESKIGVQPRRTLIRSSAVPVIQTSESLTPVSAL